MSESRAVRLAAKLSGTPARLLHPDVVESAQVALLDAFEAGAEWALREHEHFALLELARDGQVKVVQEMLDAAGRTYLAGDAKDNAGQSTKP